jgi:hypothetical protein
MKSTEGVSNCPAFPLSDFPFCLLVKGNLLKQEVF